MNDEHEKEIEKRIGEFIGEDVDKKLLKLFIPDMLKKAFASKIMPIEVSQDIIIFGLVQKIKEIESEIESKKWSHCLGSMSWEQAKELCENQHMALPTKEELLLARKKGVMKAWNDTNGDYWSSDLYLDKHAYSVNIFSETFTYSNKLNNKSVRCIR